MALDKPTITTIIATGLLAGSIVVFGLVFAGKMLNIAEPLYRTCALTWSEDQKIALTSSRVIYVYQLKSTLHSTSNNTSSKTEPLMEVTVVTVPDHLDPIDVGITLTTVEERRPTMKRYCNGKHRPNGEVAFKLSQWTPSDCSLHGGCLLTCLTNGDHLILFAPPTVFGCQWRKIKVVSDALHEYWKVHCYDNSESVGDDEDFLELDKRRQLLGVTSFLWLPGVLRTHEDSTVVMVVTTETNHVVFIRCVFDILQGDIACTVDHVIQLPTKLCGWGCKMAFMQHREDIFLSIGCFSGDVYLLTVGGASKSFACTNSQPHPIIDSSDNIPVTELKWEKISKPSLEHCILVVAKNQLMLVVRVPLMGGAISTQGVIRAHTFPCSGLASLPDGRFVSCSRDKSVLELSPSDCRHDPVNGMATNVKVVPMNIPITGEPIGIATSYNGLFIALSEMVAASKNVHAQCCKICFIKRVNHPLELIGYFENMVTMETPLYLCWDVFELLRQLLHADTTVDINSLLSPAILQGMDAGNRYCLQLARRIMMTTRSCDHLENVTINNFDIETLDYCNIRNHVCESLTHWLNKPDEYSDRDVDVVTNMLGWLRALGPEADEGLRRDVQVKLESLSHVSRSHLCPVCGAMLNWTTYNTLQCSNQHKWSSCHITCAVLGRYSGRRCTQCGACTTKGLQELKLLPLRAPHVCLQCGGSLQIL